MEKMNPEVKADWIAALRSGEYPQTRARLWRHIETGDDSRPAGYCCLGVLTDLYNKKTGKGSWVADGFFGMRFTDETGEGSATGLTRAVEDWANLHHGDAGTELVEFNDSIDSTRHRDFNGIADWIEENL